MVQFNRKNEQPVTAWYCTCSAGGREVGMCSYIAVLLWHLEVEKVTIPMSIYPLSGSKLPPLMIGRSFPMMNTTLTMVKMIFVDPLEQSTTAPIQKWIGNKNVHYRSNCYYTNIFIIVFELFAS